MRAPSVSYLFCKCQCAMRIPISMKSYGLAHLPNSKLKAISFKIYLVKPYGTKNLHTSSLQLEKAGQNCTIFCAIALRTTDMVGKFRVLICPGTPNPFLVKIRAFQSVFLFKIHDFLGFWAIIRITGTLFRVYL